MIPFNAPGEPLILWDGYLLLRPTDGSQVRRPGRVTLDWRRPGHLQWAVAEDTASPKVLRAWHQAFRDTKTIVIDFGGRLSKLDASMGTDSGGVINGGIIGDPGANLESMTVHWVGLPHLMFGAELHTHAGEEWTSWAGRTARSIHGWNVTLDERPDAENVIAGAAASGDCVMTHVMEVRRSDGATFTASQASDLLLALQLAVSFAVGHWVYPAAPVGFNAAGEAVWTEWRPGFADPPRSGLGWWDQFRPDDLWEVVDQFLDHWDRPDRRSTLHVAAIQAVSAVEDGFVEQRLLTTFTAMEMLSWAIEVHERPENERRPEGKDAGQRLRRLLVVAHVPLAIDRASTPALAAWAKSQKKAGDGPAAVSAVRHRLAHPKDNSDLYDADGLLFEAHRVALRYLELVLLHRLGYTGHVCDRTKRDRWAGDSDPVPWAVCS